MYVLHPHRIKVFGFYAALLVVTVTVPGARSTSLFDILPVVAQAKSLFQMVTGDFDGALNTQKNFVNDGLITSQARSAYFLVTGEPQKALDIQKEFGKNAEPLIDGLPVIGHLKGAIHLAVGDTRHGVRALESATSNLSALAGGWLAGPVGSMFGQVATDAFISLLEKLTRDKNAELPGLFGFMSNMSRNTTSGEVFEELSQLALSGFAGSKIKTTKAKYNQFNYEMIPSTNVEPAVVGEMETML